MSWWKLLRAIRKIAKSIPDAIDVIYKLVEALRDGKLTAEERDELIKELTELIEGI